MSPPPPFEVSILKLAHDAYSKKYGTCLATSEDITCWHGSGKILMVFSCFDGRNTAFFLLSIFPGESGFWILILPKCPLFIKLLLTAPFTFNHLTFSCMFVFVNTPIWAISMEDSQAENYRLYALIIEQHIWKCR